MCDGEVYSAHGTMPPCPLSLPLTVLAVCLTCFAFYMCSFFPLSFSHARSSARSSLSVSVSHTHDPSLNHTPSRILKLIRAALLCFFSCRMFRLVHRIHAWRFRSNWSSSHRRTSFRTRVNACCTDCYGMKGNMIWSGNEVGLISF